MRISKNSWYNFLFYKGSSPHVIGVVLCLIISAYLGALTPRMISSLAENYEVEHLFYESIRNLAFLFVGVYVNRLIYQLIINKYVKLLMHHCRLRCYSGWLHAYEIKDNNDTKDKYPQGEVIARIMNDTESLRELMTSGTFGILIDVFFVVSSLISFITLNRVMGTALSIFEVVAALALIWGSKYMRKIFLEVRRSRADMSRILNNIVGGVKESYFTRHENYASKKATTVFDDFLHKILIGNVWDAGYYSTAESLYPILLVLVVLIFPYSAITEAAIIFAIVDLIQRSINPIKDVSAKIANIQRAWSGIFRMSEFLEDVEGTLNSQDNTELEAIELESYEIKLEEFHYPKRGEEEPFYLRDIYFKASPGELIGIVGLSGCGKSTLLNIMSANILPTKGSIHLKGKNREVIFPGNHSSDIVDYRYQVGIVSQDSHIFSNTIVFNITFKEELTDHFQKFWNDVVEQIPYLRQWGIQPTDVIDQTSLSLGQKQLLAAIRSCYLKKPVVLFDEISSALDGELELALRQMVLLVQKVSLTFIVAHRLETIFEADTIMVMENGRVVESGKHEQLQASSKVYKEFIQELSHS